MRKLESVNDLLDALKEEHGWPSDYRISKEIGVPQQTISTWRTGKKVPDETYAVTIAKALEISPARVLAIAAAARAETGEMRKVWLAIAAQIERAGIAGFVTFAVGSPAYDLLTSSVCILCPNDAQSKNESEAA